MEAFHELKEALVLDENNRLMLGDVPMLLIPRWFFAGIHQRVVAAVGLDAAAKIYSGAGFEGAYNWCRVQIEKGLTGRAVLEQYLDSMSHRGWGKFEIVEYDQEQGSSKIHYENSALALETEPSEHPVCAWFCGALEGAMQAIAEDTQLSQKNFLASETSCLAQGNSCCLFIVNPTAGIAE